LETERRLRFKHDNFWVGQGWPEEFQSASTAGFPRA
jgi:hypothetical protein